jgi:tRNA (cytidine/uridine-2'-O-)-methyltransferase
LRSFYFAPQIPPNTGNIIRLSANSGNRLHLVKPLGFTLDEKSCRRAGLDYHALSDVHIHDDLAACLDWLDQPRLFAITTKGEGTIYDRAFAPGRCFSIWLGNLGVASRCSCPHCVGSQITFANGGK